LGLSEFGICFGGFGALVTLRWRSFIDGVGDWPNSGDLIGEGDLIGDPILGMSVIVALRAARLCACGEPGETAPGSGERTGVSLNVARRLGDFLLRLFHSRLPLNAASTSTCDPVGDTAIEGFAGLLVLTGSVNVFGDPTTFFVHPGTRMPALTANEAVSSGTDSFACDVFARSRK